MGTGAQRKPGVTFGSVFAGIVTALIVVIALMYVWGGEIAKSRAEAAATTH